MFKITPPPEWGIEPVPKEQRILGFLDYFVLWSSLGVGLLVLQAGTYVVPELGLGRALLAIIIGTALGVLLLSLAGVVGSDNGVPTMVMLRPALGQRGSFLPTLLNLAQLLGWTAFELWVMAKAADHISQQLFHYSNYPLWLCIFTLWCVLLALGGPLVVVRQWLERFGIWVVYLVTIFMTIYLLTHLDLPALLQAGGHGSGNFWLAVDLVVAMPISWMPLVADYNRFARKSNSAFWGTYVGYFLANVWFYALGAMLVLVPGVDVTAPEGLAAAIMTMTGGALALAIILVDETDNAFADIYSAAVSTQNILPKVRQRLLVIIIGVVGLALATILSMDAYFNFLLLIGSVFVPLFGLLAADYFILRKRNYNLDALYAPQGAYWYRRGFNLWALLAWALGVIVYHAIARYAPSLGASIPSFLATLLLYSVLGATTQVVGRGSSQG